METRLLRINGLSKQYRALQAVSLFTAEFDAGGIYGLIGTNEAGKTTVLNMISGMEKPSSGTILFQGRDITGVSPECNGAFALPVKYSYA